MGGVAEPEVMQPHQGALKAFLVGLPAMGQQLTSTAEGSATLQTPFTQAQLSALQGVRSNAAPTRYTGCDQPGLLKKWLTDRTTTCNEFCGRCGAAMGYKASGKNDGVGRFDIADYLTRYDRGIAGCLPTVALPRTMATCSGCLRRRRITMAPT